MVKTSVREDMARGLKSEVRTPRSKDHVGNQEIRYSQVLEIQIHAPGSEVQRAGRWGIASPGHSLGRRCFGRLGLAVAQPGDQEDQPDAGADGTVGHVEGRKADLVAAPLLNVKVYEINHMPDP